MSWEQDLRRLIDARKVSVLSLADRLEELGRLLAMHARTEDELMRALAGVDGGGAVRLDPRADARKMNDDLMAESRTARQVPPIDERYTPPRFMADGAAFQRHG